MRVCLLICFVGLITNVALGQRKKSDKYAAYWALEAKKERYDSAMTVANDLFERDLLDSAKSVYKSAVSIWPEGQEAQAKIRDIQILKDRRKKEASNAKPEQQPTPEPPMPEPSPAKVSRDTLPVVEDVVTDDEKQKPFPAIREATKQDAVATKPKDNKPKPSPKTKPIATKQTAIKETKPDSVYTGYHTSSTVEEHKTKTVWTGTVISEGRRTEYRRVQHNYGAVFYFKDGISISRIRFLDEATPHFEGENLK